MNSEPIDVPSEVKAEEPAMEPNMQLARIDPGGAVGRAMSVEELKDRCDYVRRVIKEVFVEGQDYGKIPGCGDKPTLLLPGAQKLLLTFGLRIQVKKEVLREIAFTDLPYGHREYEFTVTVFPAGQPPERGWDGVGTCSTMESKYRFRKGALVCPVCGKPAIIKGKPEYGGGWKCWKKKDGCDAGFEIDDQRITTQKIGDEENQNPADQWNTVRKISFKRAQVAASINATNTSELWTQDLDDLGDDRETQTAGGTRPNAAYPRNATRGRLSAAPQDHTKGPDTTPAPQKGYSSVIAGPVGGDKSVPKSNRPLPTNKTRAWMLEKLQASEGELNRPSVTKFFIAVGALLPGQESLEDLPLRYVPVTAKDLRDLGGAIAGFEMGEAPKLPYPLADMKADFPDKEKTTAKKIEVPRDETKPVITDGSASAEPWYNVVIHIPPRGMKRAEYLAGNPDTIGSLYELRHENTADAAAGRSRLWGFLNHFEPKEYQGRPPSKQDIEMREGLDAFGAWFEANHPGEKI